MAICGTLVLVDHTIQFEVEGAECTYRVTDSVTGDNIKVTVASTAFAAALAVALHHDVEWEGISQLSEEAEKAMGVNGEVSDYCRWIP